MTAVGAEFIGGPKDGVRVALDRAPAFVYVATTTMPTARDYLQHRPKPLDTIPTEVHVYERLDDPDTGDYLGGYAYVRGPLV